MITKDILSFDRLTDMVIKEINDQWAGTNLIEVYRVTKEKHDCSFDFYPTHSTCCYYLGHLIKIAEATNMSYYVSLKEREDGSFTPLLRCY